MMARSAILVAVVASFAAAAAAGPGASAGYCYCPYGPYSRAFHNCADDCIRHADAVGPERVAQLFQQERQMVSDSVKIRSLLPANATQVVHQPHLLGDALSDCRRIGNSGGQFFCALAVHVFEGLFGHDNLVNCLADVAVAVDDFWHAGKQIESAYSDWKGGSSWTAVDDLKSSCGSVKDGLQHGYDAISECPGLGALASKIGGIIGELESGLGDFMEALKALMSAHDIVVKADDLITHWGDYIEMGEDAADIVCDLSDFFGSGCGGRRRLLR